MSTRFCTAVLQVHGVAAANTRHTTRGQEHIINQCSASNVRSRMSQRRGRESTVRSWGSDPCLRTTVELFRRTTQNSGTRCQSPFHHSWRQLIHLSRLTMMVISRRRGNAIKNENTPENTALRNMLPLLMTTVLHNRCGRSGIQSLNYAP